MSDQDNRTLGLGTPASVFVPGNRFHVDIPDSEREEGFRVDADQFGKGWSDFPLDGRTLQEVENEASRVKFGEVFSSFEEFNRCIDSWGVMNHRAVQRYKTGANCVIRNCRFGKTPNSRLARYNNSASEIPPGSSRNVELSSSDDDNEEEDGCLDTGNAGKENYDKEGWCHAENSTPRSALTWQQQEDLNFENGIREMTNSHRAQHPLRELPHNKPTEVIPSQQPSKKAKSVVKHTSEWLPGRRSLLLGTEREKAKKKSATGACGELSRFSPVAKGDPNNFCTGDECPFYVRAIRKKRSGVITITKCTLTHNCPQLGHKWRGPTSKAHWLAITLAPRVIRTVKGPVRELTVGFQQDYRRTSNYKQMWRAKDMVRDAYLGGQRRSFHCIPGFIKRLKLIDPGCKAEWESIDNCSIFERAFICPSATRKALKYCQPIVSLDACHTKNRKYPTQLFLATVLDGNMEILPLCYAVAPTENYENWRWFLMLMDGCFPDIELLTVPVMSDRCKGLIAAVKEIWPGKIHGMCANHLRANVKINFGKAAESFFLATVYANTQQLFLRIIDRLERSTANGKAAGEYIRKLDASLYARHAFPLPRFGHVTSNPCEQTNSGLLPIREFAPFKLLVEMWYYIQAHFNSSRRKANECKEQLTGPAHMRHSANLSTFGQWQVFDDCGGCAKVLSASGSEEYLVTLGPRPTCSCFELQEMMWPCEHIMAWDDILSRPFSARFHLCWRTSSWRTLYEGIVPSFLCNDIGLSSLCWPPEVAKKKGRHRFVRIQAGSRVSRTMQSGADVTTDSLGNLFLQYPIDDNSDLMDAMPTPGTAAARQNCSNDPKQKKKSGENACRSKCRVCGKPGHNKRTCPSVQSGTRGTTPIQEQEEVSLTFPESSQIAEGRAAQCTPWATEERYSQQRDAVEYVGVDELLGLYRRVVPDYPESDLEGPESDNDYSQISNVRWGTTQNPQEPDFAPVGYTGNMAGIYKVQNYLDPW